MKKLMMAVAIVCAAVAAQAVSVKWDSSKIMAAANAEGGFSSTTIAGASATMYLFTITASDYAGFLADYNAKGNMQSVWESYKDNLTAADKSNPANKRTSVASVTTEASKGDTVYGAIIYFYHDDALNKDFYIANIASGTVGSDMDITIGNLSTAYLGGSSTESIGGWQAVPEPTSAMLLVLGVAALALRRRQK